MLLIFISGCGGSSGGDSKSTTDTTVPMLAQVMAVSSPTNDATPNYTFSSSESGTITYGGACSSATASAIIGNNTVTFNTLAAGTYSNCTIRVRNVAGNQSAVLAVTAFTINAAAPADTTAPMLAQLTPVPSPTSDTTPNYTFSSSEAGTITYGGDCSSATASAIIGNNTVTFNTLAAGVHSNCTIQVKDAAGNQSAMLAVKAFTINTSAPADTTAPVLAQFTPVPSPTIDTTPDYTFSSSEAGTIGYGGDCLSETTSAIIGNNTITFNTLANGVYSNCVIIVMDAAGNASAMLVVSSFTIDTVPAVAQKPYNDTGIALCGDYAATDIDYSPYHVDYIGSGTDNNDVNCASAGTTQTTAGIDSHGDVVLAGQDAVYGRDANLATNRDSDGWKGFSFTKLKSNGTPLAIQNGTWSDAGSETAGTQWSCVQDNVTGLVWEAKTNDGGLHDKDNTYAWYNTDSATNGGSAGSASGGVCSGGTGCNTQTFVTDVNMVGLCGVTDWRLPSIAELKTLRRMDTSPAIDINWLPNRNDRYWSASSSAVTSHRAWSVYFPSGGVGTRDKNESYPVRLVRGRY